MNNDELLKYGIDVKEALERFWGDEEFYSSLLKTFLNDQSLEKALAWRENHDGHKLFENTHELKGESGNLSLTKVFSLSSAICDLMRQEPYPSDLVISEMLNELEKAENKAKDGIRKLIK